MASVWSTLRGACFSPIPKTAETKAADATSTKFFGSQVGGTRTINYSYTDDPLLLIWYDTKTFFQYFWALPYIVLPFTPTDSGDLCELSLTRENLFCIFIHVILCITQLALIVAIPFLVLLPVWAVALGLGLFILLNNAICSILNGEDVEIHSDEKYAPALPEHEHEQFIFVNGVAVGKTWMKSNLNRLALTFKRPVLGIHNKTSGILFDVIECLVQRNLGYATEDVRVCYKRVKEKLYDPKLSKVVLILHSQGGIIGSLVIDWALSELPQDVLSKLEVYTFGCAANHFNNPHRNVQTQLQALNHPVAASVDATQVAEAPVTRHGLAPEDSNQQDHRPPTPVSPSAPPSRPEVPAYTASRPSEFSLGPSETSSMNPAAASGRAIAHIEHYAHTRDFVALWGVLHFATSALGKHSMPRFIGRVFAQPSLRGGHQLNQHYLDLAFPLVRDPDTGELVGCAESGNAFMESEIEIGSEGDGDSSNLREAMETSWLGWAFDDDDDDDDDRTAGDKKHEAEVRMHTASPVEVAQRRGRWRTKTYGNADVEDSGTASRTYKVKELSRLWQYRNGKSPKERSPLLSQGANGVVMNATM